MVTADSAEVLDNSLHKLQVKKCTAAEIKTNETRNQFYGDDKSFTITNGRTEYRQSLPESDDKMKQILAQLSKLRKKPILKASHLNEQIKDFYDLLNSFLLEMDDFSDDKEPLLDKEGIMWFLKELDLRFAVLRKEHEDDQNNLESFFIEFDAILQNATMTRDLGSLSPDILEGKETQIAKLEEKITQLEKCTSNHKKFHEIKNPQFDCIHDDLRQKYKLLELRHRETVGQMQNAVTSRNKEIKLLKEKLEACRDKGENDNISQAKFLQSYSQNSGVPSYENAEIKSLEEDLEDRNNMILNLQEELERNKISNKNTHRHYVDKIRIRCLEDIVNDLEIKLSEATGFSRGSHVHNSSLFNRSEVNISPRNIRKDSSEKEQMQQEILELATQLEFSENKRAEMIDAFAKEREFFVSRLNQIRHVL